MQSLAIIGSGLASDKIFKSSYNNPTLTLKAAAQYCNWYGTPSTHHMGHPVVLCETTPTCLSLIGLEAIERINTTVTPGPLLVLWPWDQHHYLCHRTLASPFTLTAFPSCDVRSVANWTLRSCSGWTDLCSSHDDMMSWALSYIWVYTQTFMDYFTLRQLSAHWSRQLVNLKQIYFMRSVFKYVISQIIRAHT